MEPKFEIYKYGVKMPQPTREEIALAQVLANSLGAPFLETFDRNMATLGHTLDNSPEDK